MQQQMSRRFNLEFALICLFALFAVALLADTLGLSQTPALFPRIVGTVVLVLTLYMIVQRLLQPARARTVAPEAGDEEEEETGSWRLINTGAGIVKLPWYQSLVLLALYFVLLYLIGFVPATLIYGFGIPYLMGYRNLPVLALFALGMSVALSYALYYAFSIMLPNGVLFGMLTS